MCGYPRPDWLRIWVTPSQCVSGVKWTKREADLLPPRAEVTISLNFTPPPAPGSA
jgi:hypothetical protein